jgi:hypothetical protein
VSAIGGFEAYVGASFGRLLRTAYQLTGDRALAEELVHLTLTEARADWPEISDAPDRHVRELMGRLSSEGFPKARTPSCRGTARTRHHQEEP